MKSNGHRLFSSISYSKYLSILRQTSNYSKAKLLLPETPDRRCRSRRVDGLPSAFRAAMGIKIELPGNHFQYGVAVFKIKSYLILSDPCPGRHIFARLVRISLIGPSGVDSQFIIPLVMMFIFTSYVSHATLRGCHICLSHSKSVLFTWIMEI
jgi:hypothetical protein